MEFSAKQIAHLLQGVVEGNEEVIVNKLCKIEEKNAPFLRKKFINRTKCSNFTNFLRATANFIKCL